MWVWYLGIGGLSLLIGSFLNLAIHRLPIMLERAWTADCQEFLKINPISSPKNSFNLCWPRSHCPKCQASLKNIDNIPVLSYLFLRGKCRFCRGKISPRYPLIELFSMAMGILLVQRFHLEPLKLGFALLLSYCLIVMSMIDIDHLIIPDSLTLPMLWIGLLINNYCNLFQLPSACIWGAAIAYGSFWSIWALFKLLTGKDGIGQGDFKLLAMFGAWFGWQALPFIIFVSSVLGSIIGILGMLKKGYQKYQTIPYGPFICVAGWLYMYFLNHHLSHWLNPFDIYNNNIWLS